MKLPWIPCLLLVSVAAAAAPPTPEQRCESSQNLAAGAYAACLQKALASRAAGAEGPEVQAAVTKCGNKFFAKFEKAAVAASRKGASCPAANTDSELRNAVDDHADAIAASLAGAPLPVCGDGAINRPGEHCDLEDLGGETCASLGLPDGPLACDVCTFAAAGCDGCEADGGVRVGGFCWFASPAGTSCDTRCSNVGRSCSTAGTVDFAGSNGSNVSCAAVVDAVFPGGAPHTVTIDDVTGCGSSEAGIGCVMTETGDPYRVIGPPTNCAATGIVPGVCVFGGDRLCACGRN